MVRSMKLVKILWFYLRYDSHSIITNQIKVSSSLFKRNQTPLPYHMSLSSISFQQSTSKINDYSLQGRANIIDFINKRIYFKVFFISVYNEN